MNILAVDIGTGTQDVLYLNTRLAPENAYRVVGPAPTMVVAQAIRECTGRREALVLQGRIMGGGPSQWAAEDHVRAGLAVYATPEAARSFDDDLEQVETRMGIRVVSEEEADLLPGGVRRIRMGDFDFGSLASSFSALGVALRPQALLIAAFDHGHAPPGYSDRRFRFERLDEHIRESGRLTSLAFGEGRVPPTLTRLRAIEASARGVAPRLMLMDSGVAAVLGALLDPFLSGRTHPVVVNMGNFHVLGFRLHRSESDGSFRIDGLFEHHTGLLDRAGLEGLLERLAQGDLTNAEVFDSQGHGALIYRPAPLQLGGEDSPLAVVGPRRDVMRGSRLQPYFAAPYGDMMLAGAYGLVRAAADVFEDLRGEVTRVLGNPTATAPWESTWD